MKGVDKLHDTLLAALTARERELAAWTAGDALAAHLAALRRVAYGDERATLAAVEELERRLLRALWLPPLGERPAVPIEFWDTPLGGLIGRAKLRAHPDAVWLEMRAARERLRVASPTVYRWMADGTLGFARDRDAGRFYVLARDVDALRGEADR